ncbi:hypothetical protein ACIQC5_13700 [Paenarthrobacter sp. NPDC092416]|uniref:hypothetical protein n=1 Tax=Paenarthrobacter sp. NPDC092416 TaxID=3364386 RepID=UPI003822DDAF
MVDRYELQVIEGCPNTDRAMELFRRILAEEGQNAPVRLRVLTSDTEASELGFRGSPSFVENGRDLFPSDVQPALSCRVYLSANGMKGLPSPEVLRQALRAGLNPGTPTGR